MGPLKIASQRLKRDPIPKNEFLEKNSSPFLTANLTSNFLDGFSIVKTFDIGISILFLKYSKLDFGLKYIFFISKILSDLRKGCFLINFKFLGKNLTFQKSICIDICLSFARN